ncbi:hypothetical protein Y032_0017g3266 [Ancylostoma ceylanicum]|uniref:F-box domain-containing protein n=3 Tax=Ancylostoma ceylanicum TaxID=53326 RepID=A0A016V6C7_9BILA|nr:hypothetical protein Y032_0017g3266 [Ancylostoma ceylanicum]
MERLNRDVILHICSYLDLGTLASLAAVYPHMSSEIFRIFKSTVWAFKMRILPQYTSMAFFSVTKPKTDSYDNKALQDTLKVNLVMGKWAELPARVRKYVPYHLMHIACLDVTQFGSATMSEQVEKILGSMTTDQLSLKYENRREGKKALERVSFNPGTTLYIHELSFCEAIDSLIPPPQLINIKDLWFCGDILPKDFTTLLYSSIPSLCLTCDRLRQDCVLIIREYIKNFLEGRTNQTSCRISASGGLLRYVFEYLAGVGEDCMVNGPRRVHLITALEETPIHCFIDAVDSCT